MMRHLAKLVSEYYGNRNNYYVVKTLHTMPPRLVEEYSQGMENKHLGKMSEVLGKYDEEMETKMLNLINNSNLKDLLGYEISKGRASKLIAWRERNGALKNLTDIFYIGTFGLKVAEKFFQSLLAEPKSIELNLSKAPVKTSSFVTPSIEAERRKLIKSSVSVRVGVNSITWARLVVPSDDAPCLLTHWQHHEISEKKLHINQLIKRCLYVHQLIPPADCYLFENPQMAQVINNPVSTEHQNINIQKLQVTAMMGYALASRNNPFNSVLDNESDTRSSGYDTTVFYVRRFLTARLFKHLVGTERTSSEETILRMMGTFYNTNDDCTSNQQGPHMDAAQELNNSNANLSGSVQIPMELRQMFSNVPRYYREFLGQTLLLNLAFVRLVLLEDAESIATVSRNSKTKTVISADI